MCTRPTRRSSARGKSAAQSLLAANGLSDDRRRDGWGQTVPGLTQALLLAQRDLLLPVRLLLEDVGAVRKVAQLHFAENLDGALPGEPFG